MKHVSKIHSRFTLFILLCPFFVRGALPTGSGDFSFVSPRTHQSIQVFYVKSPDYNPENPPVMVFHGRGRNAEEYRDGWIDLAMEHGFFVVAPLFSSDSYKGSTGYNLGNVFPSISNLTLQPEQEWSFRVPDDVFSYLEAEGETVSKHYIAFGHSAGSQFLHRKLAFAPDDRLQFAVAANAGWYTLPSLQNPWPYGYRGTSVSDETLRSYLSFPLQVLLGEKDVDTEDSGLRRTPEAMEQGPHRLARGSYFYEFGKRSALKLAVPFRWKLSMVPGVGHDGAAMAPAAADLIAEFIDAESPENWSKIWIQLLALAVIFGTVFMVIRGYQTHATLLLSGMLLLLLAFVYSNISGAPVKGFEQSLTGWKGFDLFAVIKESFATRVGKIGLIVMAAGGFARYMSSISASNALVNIAIRPLDRVKNPYLLLAIAYVIGQVLNVFIPSAAGLAMLLLVALYPTLVRLGLSPASVAAVIGTTAALDLGPASGASNVAATICGLDPSVYFVRHQIPVALIVIPVVALLHFLWQRYMDRCHPEESGNANQTIEPEEQEATAPVFYALLPIFPLFLLIIFSPLVIKSIHLDVVTAMLIGLFMGIFFESIRLRNLKKALAGIVPFFEGMGDILAKVVTLIVAAEIFATGVKATGLIDSMIEMVQAGGFGSLTMMIALMFLMGFTAIVTGSGNAALFSFANLIPSIAKSMGVSSVSLMLPTQLSASLFRSMSPVAGVIIAVASTANVSPFAIIRRTSVPILGGVIATLCVQNILF